MTKVLGISGSLRRGSYNSALLRAATGLMPAGSNARGGQHPRHPAVRRGRRGPGHPAERLAAEGGGGRRRRRAAGHAGVQQQHPGRVQEHHRLAVAAAGGRRRVFGGRRFAIIGASPGAFGTTLSQAAWLPVLRTLGVQLWTGGRLMVSRAGTVFDESGTLKDATIEEALKQFLPATSPSCRRTPPPALSAPAPRAAPPGRRRRTPAASPGGRRSRAGADRARHHTSAAARCTSAAPCTHRPASPLLPNMWRPSALSACTSCSSAPKPRAIQCAYQALTCRLVVPERRAQVVQHAQVVQRVDVAGDRERKRAHLGALQRARAAAAAAPGASPRGTR